MTMRSGFPMIRRQGLLVIKGSIARGKCQKWLVSAEKSTGVDWGLDWGAGQSPMAPPSDMLR
jgi:hypothetical protein